MIIIHLAGGLGNQFGQYVAARLLAYKLNTELKLDIRNFNTASEFSKRSHASYRLGDFNILDTGVGIRLSPRPRQKERISG